MRRGFGYLKFFWRREICVCEVMQALNITQTRASRNLGILEDAGFVVSERKGTWMHYSVNSANEYCKSIEKLLNDWLNKDTQIIEDGKRLKKAVKLGNK
jgi:ArsR family transcriptional regulator